MKNIFRDDFYDYKEVVRKSFEIEHIFSRLYPYPYSGDIDFVFLEMLVDKIKKESKEFEKIDKMYKRAINEIEMSTSFISFYAKKINDCYFLNFKNSLNGTCYLFSFDDNGNLLWKFKFFSSNPNDIIIFNKNNFMIKNYGYKGISYDYYKVILGIKGYEVEKDVCSIDKIYSLHSGFFYFDRRDDDGFLSFKFERKEILNCEYLDKNFGKRRIRERNK